MSWISGHMNDKCLYHWGKQRETHNRQWQISQTLSTLESVVWITTTITKVNETVQRQRKREKLLVVIKSFQKKVIQYCYYFLRHHLTLSLIFK